MTGIWDGSGISWTMCKQSAPRCRQITAPTAHHSIFTGRMLSPNQQCQSTEGTDINTPHHTSTTSCCSTDSERPHRCCHLANNWFCYLFFFISMYTTLRRCDWVAAACFLASVCLSVRERISGTTLPNRIQFLFFLRPWVSRYQLDLGINEASNLAQNRPLCRLISLHSATHS